MHNCNKFCLRYTKDGKMRYCRVGCGVEKTMFSADTNGFPLEHEDTIFLDTNTSIKHLKLKRTSSRRMTQCSKYLLQSWRANCDLQLLIYESHPNKPNIEEIRKVTDYVVSYTTKVNQSIPEERKVIKEIIANTENQTESDENDLMLVCRRVLNSFHNKRLISRAEAMIEISGLPLIVCSETIEPVNISSMTRITKTKDYSSNFINSYKNRKAELDKSLIEYFHITKRQQSMNNSKVIIPHPIGRINYPKFIKSSVNHKLTPHYDYMKSVIILHKAWKDDELSSILKSKPVLTSTFEQFLKSKECPISVKNRHYTALKHRKNSMLCTYQDTSIFRDYVDSNSFDYEPSNDEDEENFFQFLRTKGKGLRTVDGQSIYIDYEYRWDLQNCIVSTYLHILKYVPKICFGTYFEILKFVLAYVY